MLYDVFICHASEDKEFFVRPLAEALRNEHIEVWFDEFSLKLGDSIRRSVDKGLSQSRFGLVVLSKAFFKNNWPQYELDGLVQRQMRGKDTVIMPIWHKVDYDDVASYSLPLADRKAVSSSIGIARIVQEVYKVIHPQGSPLIEARDILLEYGLTPPVITDKYWLDIVEASNRVPGYGAVIPEQSSWGRWSFPLPPKENAQQWGERLAFAAMQLNWVKTAEEALISPLTHPEKVLFFIYSHPGLLDICKDCPNLLAEYAPQLTIRGFEGELEKVIEYMYLKSCAYQEKERASKSQFGTALTINNKCPACGPEWALRHPTFGDYKPAHIAKEYFSGGLFGPTVSPFEVADHTFWLLSSSSDWLPRPIHNILVKGMMNRNLLSWVWYSAPAFDQVKKWKTCGVLAQTLSDVLDGKKVFRWTSDVRDDVINRIRLTVTNLSLPETPEELCDRFIRLKFISFFIKAQQHHQSKETE